MPPGLGTHAPRHSCLLGMHTPRDTHAPSGHACPPLAHMPPGTHAPPPADTTRCAELAGGTHHTGMHSC